VVRCAVLWLAIAAGVSWCLGCRSTGGGKDPARSITGEWVLGWMHGRGPDAPPEGRGHAWIRIEADGQLRGHTGLNQLSGAVDAGALTAAEFRPGPVATTKMGGPPAVMEYEAEFLRLLQRSTRFRVDEGVLVLSDDSGELLRFDRASGERPGSPGAPIPSTPSIHGEWILEWMDGRGPVTAPAGRESPRLSIAADGGLRGWTCVNHLSGQLDAGALKRGEFAAGPMAMTEMGAEPEAMQLEADFARLLGRATRFRIDEDRTLVLSDDSGELLRFARKP